MTMQRVNVITLLNQQEQKITFVGEPLLKRLDGAETLILPNGSVIPLMQVRDFNGICFAN
jgi:hypothetical protein